MYGDFSAALMVQIVVLQGVIWNNVLIFMFEYRGAKLLIASQFPETAGSITSFRVEPDIVSLSETESVQADADIGDDGKVRFVVGRSNASSIESSSNKPPRFNSLASDLSGREIFSVQSSWEPPPRASSYNQNSFPKLGKANSYQGDACSSGSSKRATPRLSSFSEKTMDTLVEDKNSSNRKRRGGRSMSERFNGGLVSSYTPPYLMFPGRGRSASTGRRNENGGSDPLLRKNVSSSSMFPVSEADSNLRPAVNRSASARLAVVSPCRKAPLHYENADSTEIHELIDNTSPAGRKVDGDRDHHIEIRDQQNNPPSGSSPFSGGRPKQMEVGEGDGDAAAAAANKKQQMPPATVMARLILLMGCRKLIRNPNTHASVIALVWSLIANRWEVKMPTIVAESISILGNGGLGLPMFSLGLFMGLQPKLIPCGKSAAALSMAIRFLAGPGITAAAAAAVGVRGVLLQVAIVQAAIPQGVVPFVFAQQYNVHADILSTAVIFGMLIALPVTTLYCILLGL